MHLSQITSEKKLSASANKQYHKNIGASPAAWDWTTLGAVTPVKDQGKCRFVFHFYYFSFSNCY